MKVLKTIAVAMLGSAALLPALPAWADAAKMEVAATDTAKSDTVTSDTAKSDTVKSDTAKPAAPGTPVPPLTVTAKPGTPDTGARDQAMEQRRADHKAFMEARLAALRAGLQLTADQQSLWGPVESALRDLAKTRHEIRHAMHEAVHGAMRDGGDDKDPAARLKLRGEHLVAMGQAIGRLADASGPLLGALTPEQKHRLPMLIHGVGPHRLVKQAFGIEGHDGHHGWGREGMRFGMRGEGHEGWHHEGWHHDGGHQWGMRGGEDGGWHHRHFADRDDRDGERGGSDFGGRGFDRQDRDRPGMDRDGGGRHGHHGWDGDGRADRDGRDDRGGDRGGHRFDREDGGPSRHFQHDGNNSDDDRIGG